MKVLERKGSGPKYSVLYQTFNITVRTLKLTLDLIIVFIFVRLFSYYLKQKKAALKKRDMGLSSFQKKIVVFAVIVTIANAYRQTFVAVFGVASQFDIDSSTTF